MGWLFCTYQVRLTVLKDRLLQPWPGHLEGIVLLSLEPQDNPCSDLPTLHAICTHLLSAHRLSCRKDTGDTRLLKEPSRNLTSNPKHQSYSHSTQALLPWESDRLHLLMTDELPCFWSLLSTPARSRYPHQVMGVMVGETSTLYPSLFPACSSA